MLRRCARAWLRRCAALACALVLGLPAAGARAEESRADAAPLFPIRQGDLHGLIDHNGRVVLAPEYTEIRIGSPWILLSKGARVAYADAGGRLVIEPQDELTQPYAEGRVPMRGKDAQGRMRWGYADASRRMAIAPAFDDAGPFVGGLAVVGIADTWGQVKYGAIDRDGRLVVNAVHDKLLEPAGTLVRAQSRERTHRVFDARGRDITPAGVDFVGIPSEGLVRVWAARQQGFMTTAGDLVVPPRYAQAGDFKDGVARVWIDGKYGYIDRRGELVIPARYESAEDSSDGLALVKSDGQAQFVDHRGRTVLTPKADRVWPFSQGLAVVKVGARHGYIDRRGQMVIEPQFTFARAFQNGLAYVGLPGRGSAYIRTDGQVVWRGGP